MFQSVFKHDNTSHTHLVYIPADQSCYKYIALNERPAADNYKPLHHIERKNKSIFDNQSHREKKSVTDQQWSNGTSSQFTARNG